jgi:hypothetical protein
MIEKLYEDFTTKLLPQIQEGLTITKDYFVDLFGRYIQYLIIKDAFLLALGVLGLIVVAILVHKAFKTKNPEIFIPACTFGAFGILVFGLMALCNGDNLIKSIYIPEVRVYQEFKSYSNSVN